MADELPSLHALHCFDTAARAGSFTAAARALHRTHGAISRQIQNLEAELGVALFVRGGRHVTLTPEGQALLVTTERAFASLREGIAGLARRRGGPVVLSCEPTLALHWLIPRLAELERQGSGLVVHVESRGGPVDFERSGVTIAVRRRDFAIGAGVRCEPLMDEWLGPVCSPAYARELDRRPRVTLLQTRTRPEGFDDWMRAAGHPLDVARERWFDHFAWSLQAAIAGLGLALGPYPLVKEALGARQLVAPFGFRRGEVGYVLLSREGEEEERARLVRRWLTREAASAEVPRRLRRARPGVAVRP